MGGWTGNYTAKNFGNASFGPVTVQRATNSSINVAYLSMAQQLDLCDIRDTAAAMGVERADGNELQANLTSVLGTNEIAPMSMATALATIAANGKACEPIGVDKFVNSSGEELPGQTPKCSQALTPDVAAALAYGLQQVMNSGTGSPSNPRNGRPLIGKTGTTDASVHTWMVGASTKVSLAVWVGNIVGHVGTARIGLGTGRADSARHRIFRPVISALTGSYGGGAFPSPPASLLAGNVQPLPSFAGQSVEATRAALEGLGLIFVDGGLSPSSQPAGTVAGTNPRAGTRLSPGFEVIVYTSDGSLAVEMPNLIGMDAHAAKDKLVNEYGFKPEVIKFTFAASPQPSDWCKVASTSPAAGSTGNKHALTTLVIHSDVAGQEPPCWPAPPAPPAPPGP